MQGTKNSIFERMAQVRRSLPSIAPELFHIRTKDTGIQKWVPSEAQLRILLGTKTGADIILKARQLGVSTMTVLEFLAYFLFVDGFNGIIISEDEHKAKRLLQIAWLALDMLPDKYKLPMKYGRDRYLVSEAPIYDKHGRRIGGGRGSSLYIGSAGNFTLGRGDTFHAVHMSELAFWPSEADKDAETILSGLEESVPDRPGAILRIESTANGYGNVFHQRWVQSQRSVGRYRGIFFPWWFSLDDEYRKPVRETIKLTDDEMALKEMAWRKYKFKLEPEHFQWRRDKIAAKGKVFWQEYAEDADTCFLSTGTSVFSSIMDVLEQVRRRLELEEPVYTRDRHEVECKYWKGARSGHQYAISVDMAEGEKESSDFHALVVADVTDRKAEEVVTAKARVGAPEFAQVVMELATEYNGALVAVERASKGYSVIDTLLQNEGNTNYDYRIYYHEEFDKEANKLVKIPGWRPSRSSREVAVQRFGEDVKAGDYKAHDAEVIGQAMAFQHNPRTGKMEALRGTFDDMLNCAFIVNFVKAEGSAGAAMGVEEWD